MQLANGALNKIVNRPFILIFSSILAMIYCLVDMSNPAIAILFGFSAIGGGDILATAISLIQLMLSPSLLMKALVLIVLGIVILSPVLSLLFSGYFYILKKTVEGRPANKGEFILGTRQYFKKILKMTLLSLGLGVIFIVVMIVVFVPILFTAWSWKAGKSELFGMMVLLAVLTLGVTFFVSMFFRLYLFYWYPAAYSFESGSFRNGKRIVDSKFWTLVGRWAIIDIIFIVFELALLFARYRISISSNENTIYIALLFSFKFLFTAAFFTGVTTFIFASFETIKTQYYR